MDKKELMREAIRLSEENVRNGGGPFGAVIARDGQIVAVGVNRVTSEGDPTSHAEVNAIRAASLWQRLTKSFLLTASSSCFNHVASPSPDIILRLYEIMLSFRASGYG